MRCKLCAQDQSGVTGDDPYCSRCDDYLDRAHQQGAQDERRAIAHWLRIEIDRLKDLPANRERGLILMAPHEMYRLAMEIETRGQQQPQTEEDLSPVERERLGIITQLEYRWSMAGGAKRDGLAEAIVVVKSRNQQPPSEEPKT